jgi:membrane protease YdiL (CAAX protease family)
MRSARELIIAIARNVFRRGEVASVPLVFLSIPFVALLQYPAYLLSNAGYLSASILANEIVAVLGVPLILITVLHFSPRRLIPFRNISAGKLAAFLVFMLGAVVLIDYLTAISELVFPLPEEIRQQLDRVMYSPDTRTFVFKIFVLCLVPAVCEEIYFRGFIQTSLRARWGAPWALVISAVLFAAMHGNIHYLHLYFLLGLIFGWAYEVSGTLWASIACHALNNCWTFVNHVRDFEIPIEGVPLHTNVAIAVASVAVVAFGFFVMTKKLRMASPSKPR